jgi:hypothetical protein
MIACCLNTSCGHGLRKPQPCESGFCAMRCLVEASLSRTLAPRLTLHTWRCDALVTAAVGAPRHGAVCLMLTDAVPCPAALPHLVRRRGTGGSRGGFHPARKLACDSGFSSASCKRGSCTSCACAGKLALAGTGPGACCCRRACAGCRFTPVGGVRDATRGHGHGVRVAGACATTRSILAAAQQMADACTDRSRAGAVCRRLFACRDPALRAPHRSRVLCRVPRRHGPLATCSIAGAAASARPASRRRRVIYFRMCRDQGARASRGSLLYKAQSRTTSAARCTRV